MQFILSQNKLCTNLCVRIECISLHKCIHIDKIMTQITTVLNELQDDVIIERTATTDYGAVESDTPIKETKTEKAYIQQKQYFLETTRDKLTNTDLENENRYNSAKWNQSVNLENFDATIDVAIRFQQKSHIVSNLCCGLLGGISLMQLVLTYTLVNGSKHELISFIELYSKFGHVPSATFSILTTICLVFAFDRIDIVTIRQLIQPGEYKFYSNWTLLILYTVAFILSALCFKFDEFIAAYPESKTLLSSSLDLSVWRTLNLWRCIFGIVGWFFVCITRPEDLLEHRLCSLKKTEH